MTFFKKIVDFRLKSESNHENIVNLGQKWN